MGSIPIGTTIAICRDTHGNYVYISNFEMFNTKKLNIKDIGNPMLL